MLVRYVLIVCFKYEYIYEYIIWIYINMHTYIALKLYEKVNISFYLAIALYIKYTWIDDQKF